MMRNRVVTGIAVVAAIAAGGVGGALIGVPGLSGATPFHTSAATTATTAAPGAKIGGRMGAGSPLLDAAATALHLTTQQLIGKLSDGKTTIADVARQQNVKIDDVIAAMTTTDKDRIGNIVNKPWPQFGAGPGPGAFFRPGAGPAMRGGFGFGFFNASLDAVAKALDISTADLKTDLGKGQTIEQIATGKGLKVDDVINKLVGDASAKIDQAVTNKHLPQPMADKLKAALKTEITNLVKNGFPKGPMGGFRFHGRRGFGGPDGGPSFGGPGSGSTTTTKPPTS
jgi:hypothetical protein